MHSLILGGAMRMVSVLRLMLLKLVTGTAKPQLQVIRVHRIILAGAMRMGLVLRLTLLKLCAGSAKPLKRVCYETGNGVDRDVSAALYWFRMAARAGSKPAVASLARLGFALEEGTSSSLSTVAVIDVPMMPTLPKTGESVSVASFPPNTPYRVLVKTCAADECTVAPAFACSRCLSAVYCSAACQRAHWRAHKPACQVQESQMGEPEVV